MKNKNKRNKEYLLMVMGYWDDITDIITELIEVLTPVTSGTRTIKYIHADNALICIFRSKEDFAEMNDYIESAFRDIVEVYILLPKTRNFGIRMEETLKRHLLSAQTPQNDDGVVLQNLKELIKSDKNPEQSSDEVRIPKKPVVLDLDTILDKISAEGIDSLTPEEKSFLKDQSKN
jgi:hypothetical protein|tara:strand:+ start:131 stop:658 length:528 start_codon:yes stop_codon:yes gene_type:complete